MQIEWQKLKSTSEEIAEIRTQTQKQNQKKTQGEKLK